MQEFAWSNYSRQSNRPVILSAADRGWVPILSRSLTKEWAGLDDATAESGFVLGIPTLPKTGEG